MKPIRALAFSLAVALVVAVGAAGGALAGPFFLELANEVAGATGYSSFNANIRGSDGRLTSQRLSTTPIAAEVRINDNTGETLTTPTAAVIKSATLSLCDTNTIRGASTICTPADGSITIKKSGLYWTTFCVQNSTVTAATTQTLMLYRKDGAASVAEESPRLRASKVTGTGETGISMCASGLVNVSAAQAVAAGGQVFDVRVTASGGNHVVKDYRFTMVKIDELDPATP